MTAYIELIIASNFFTGGITLFITSVLSHSRIIILRICLASLFSAILSLIIISLSYQPYQFILRILTALTACAICIYERKKYSAFLRFCLLFFFTNIILLGCIYLLMVVFNIKFSQKNGIIFADNIFTIVLFGIFLGILSCILFMRMYRKAKLISQTVCRITVDGFEISTLIDTGNKLSTPFSKIPVMIVDSEAYKQFGDVDENIALPFRTVNGKGIMYGFEPKEVYVDYLNERKKVRLIVSSSKEPINGEFNAIVGPAIIY